MNNSYLWRLRKQIFNLKCVKLNQSESTKQTNKKKKNKKKKKKIKKKKINK